MSINWYKAITISVLLLLVNILTAGETTYIEQDFDDSKYFKPGKISSQGDLTQERGRWSGQNDPAFEIVTSPVHSKPHALRIKRVSSPQRMWLARSKPFPEKRNYKVSFWCYAKDLNRFGLFVTKSRNLKQIIGGISLSSMQRLMLYNPEKEGNNKWQQTKLTAPHGSWFLCELKFDVGRNVYWMEITDNDKETQKSREFPLEISSPMTALFFLNTPPNGSSVVVDDIKVTYESEEASDVSDRTNYTLAAKLDKEHFNAVKDKNYQTGVDLKGETDLTIDLGTDKLVDMIRIYSGKPNGTGKLNACQINGLNASGQHPELSGKGTEKKRGNLYFTEYNFNPEVLSSLSFKFKAGNAFVQEIEILSPKIVNADALKEAFQKKVYGEFRLPVYQDQKTAYLYLYNTDKMPYKVALTLTERFSGKTINAAREINLRPGENKIPFDLGNLKDGYYVAAIQDATSNSKNIQFLRSLRVQKPMPSAKKNLYTMSGKKMFFPDDHYLASYRNLVFKTCEGKLIEAVKPNLDSNDFTQLGNNIFFDSNGKLNILFHRLNRSWGREQKRRYFLATASLDNLSDWKIQKLDRVPRVPEQSYAGGEITGLVQPGKKNGQAVKLRFYDPAKDGKVRLDQVRVWFISRGAKDSEISGDISSLNWSAIKPQRGSGWPIWFKAPGVGLVLTRTPLYQDMAYVLSELEDPKASNDNWAGQFLAEDGKTFFFTRAMCMRRFPPFNAPWDNLPGVSRILTVFYTQDGLNYKSRRMALPDLTDPVASQHYGGSIRLAQNGNGLMLMYTMRYKAYTQQIDLTMAYSWDGIHWEKFPGDEVLGANGSHGSFSGGHVWSPSIGINRGNKTYYLIPRIGQVYHFQSEIANSMDAIKKVSAKYMKARFEPRQFEKCPLFKLFGSWEKLAEDTLNWGVGVGVLVCRKDGLFCVEAGGQKGEFVTLPLKAADSMKINAEIDNGGYIKLQLTDTKGNPLPGYSGANAALLKCGDYMDEVLSFGSRKRLPDTEFKIVAEVFKAKLFTLSFE